MIQDNFKDKDKVEENQDNPANIWKYI